MHFISAIILACTFILFMHTYLSFVLIFVCLLAIVMFFTSGAAFMEDVCNAKSRHVFMLAFC